jgi:hypothetical protein
MEAEVGGLTGAELGERAPDRRQTQRNGYRQRRWDTRVGELELAIPRLRTGSYFPSFLLAMSGVAKVARPMQGSTATWRPTGLPPEADRLRRHLVTLSARRHRPTPVLGPCAALGVLV